MSTTYAQLRRALAQRLSFWGGDIQNNGPGTVGSSTATTLVDLTRPEPDSEWDNSYIVLNPGASSNVIWRRTADGTGWVQNTGTFTLVGSWPAPYQNGPPAGTPYEVYKVFRPEAWLQAVNFAITKAYPKRHRPIDFEIPQNYKSRLLDYGRLGKELNSIPNPSTSLAVTEVADGFGAFQPGTYTLAYTYYSDLGETLQSPTTTVNIAGTNSRIDIGQLTNVPSAVLGVNYYCSGQPNDTNLDMLDLGSVTFPNPPAPSLNIPQSSIYTPGLNLNGTVYEMIIPSPNPWYGVAPPSYNTTTIDNLRLHHILQRINPGGYPEIWNELGGDMWRPLGGTRLMLMYQPITQFNLRMICTTTLPILATDTDVTQEPTELIYSGGEAFLWSLLTKTSTIVNVNWQKLYEQSWASYQSELAKYAMDVPHETKHRPVIRTMY